MQPKTPIHHDILTQLTALTIITNHHQTHHTPWKLTTQNTTTQYNPHTKQVTITTHKTQTNNHKQKPT